MQNMAAMGRNGDTQLAHVSPFALACLRQVLKVPTYLNSGIYPAFMDMG